MYTVDPKIIEGLQSTAQMLSNLSGQYRVYVMNVKFFGVKWLAKALKCHYRGAETQLDVFLKRLFKYGIDPEYDMGSVTGSDDVEAILDHLKQLIDGLMDHAIEQRKLSFDTYPDYTTDIYEHLIKEVEHQACFINQQLNLIKILGQSGYIGSRLGS